MKVSIGVVQGGEMECLIEILMFKYKGISIKKYGIKISMK